MQICKDDQGQSESPTQKQIHKLSPSTQHSTSTHSTYGHTSKKSSGRKEETTLIRVEAKTNKIKIEINICQHNHMISFSQATNNPDQFESTYYDT